MKAIVTTEMIQRIHKNNNEELFVKLLKDMSDEADKKYQNKTKKYSGIKKI